MANYDGVRLKLSQDQFPKQLDLEVECLRREKQKLFEAGSKLQDELIRSAERCMGLEEENSRLKKLLVQAANKMRTSGDGLD